MYIDAITCCVGSVYAAYLKRSLPVWMDTLDSLTVVTRPDDRDTAAVCAPYRRLRLVTTDVFKQHGADFNKGAALTIAYAAAAPVDLALHFDSDIMPKADWRSRAEKEFRLGYIAGATRHDEQGKPIVDKGPWPYGYFQLWSTNDPATWSWPLFEPCHGHAGNYDMAFLERWSDKKRQRLSFPVTHFGEVRQNWFGVGLEGDAQTQSYAKMAGLRKIGLGEVRKLARRREHQLSVPDFKLKLSLSLTSDPAWRRAIVRACMIDDPFLVSCVVGARRGYVPLPISTRPEYVRKCVLALRKGV